MSGIYPILVRVCWALGLLSLLAAVALKLMPALIDKLRVSPRGGLEFAVALFLCAIATQYIERDKSS
jgi:hypothetical protein